MGYSTSWLFAVQETMLEIVSKEYPNDLVKWPLRQSFEGKVYGCGEGFLYLVLYDRPTTQVPHIDDNIIPLDLSDGPSYELILTDIMLWLTYLETKLQIRSQDASLLIPYITSFPQKSDKFIVNSWDSWSAEAKLIWDYQIKRTIERHYYFIRGLSVNSNFFIPAGYQKLKDSCAAFLKDHPNFDKNVFIMTRFDQENKLLEKLDTELRIVLREYSLNPLRADDKTYSLDRNLWDNACIYMICCKYGIAILEDRVKDEFNPNVALEYGFMRALNKPVLLLADKDFNNLRADILGTLREKFDLADVENSIRSPIERWLRELN